MTKKWSQLAFFVIQTIALVQLQAFTCTEFFQIKSANSYHGVKQSYLNNTLSKEFLDLKDNPELLLGYLRSQVGYSYEKIMKLNIPYLSALVPHFEAMVDAIPERNLRSILIQINERKLLDSYFKEEVRDQKSLKAYFNRVARSATIYEFNKLAMLALYLEHVYIWSDVLREVDSSELRTVSDIFLQSLYELEKAYAVRLLPVIVFNFTDSTQFRNFWRFAASPISILDNLSDPYDGYNALVTRSRFRFALHEIFHMNLFKLDTIPKWEEYVLSFSNKKYLSWFFKLSTNREPKYLGRLKLFLTKSDIYIESLSNPVEKEFIENFMWWIAHESDYYPIVLKTMSNPSLVGTNKYQRERMMQELLVGPILIKPEYFPWIIPEPWRQRDLTHIKDKINSYLDFIESSN